MTSSINSNFLSNSIPVQELSIQWLSFPRIYSYLKIDKGQTQSLSLNKLVFRIMQKHKEYKDTQNEPGYFEKLEEFQFVSKRNYQLLIYSRAEKMATRLAKQLKEGGVSKDKLPKKTSNEFLLFFFRDNPQKEIAVLSSGRAWEAIRPCVDFTVPVALAGRILDPHRISEITRRCLLGGDIKETIHNPHGRELCKTSNIYYLVEAFKCRVKADCSLMNLSFFIESPPEIRTCSGLLRVMKKIALTDYPLLLDLFSTHIQAKLNPEKTVTYDKRGKAEFFDRNFEFLYFLTPALSSQKRLDQLAIEKFLSAYGSNQRQEFSFRHKYLQDFLEAQAYEIQFQKSARFKPLLSRPETIEEILDLLADNESSLQEAFTNSIFRYQRRDGKKVSGPLIEFIEGEIRDTEGNSYFKVRNMWYKLALDFQALLHEDYKNLLRQILIKREGEGYLPKSWAGNKPQGQFSQGEISKRFGISKGIQKFINGLKNMKVCFVERSTGKVNCRTLIGEIVKEEVIYKNKFTIETHLLSENELTLQKVKKHFNNEGETIFNELVKPRPLLVENKGKPPLKYVANPLSYLLEGEPLLKGKREKFRLYLEELHNLYAAGIENEETYNRSYLNPPFGPKNGYLVFDQICPHHIEPCDILRYNEDTTYLYHVKETLGQHTRDACSQILNAAKELRSALSTQHEEDFLTLMWKMGTGQLTDKKLDSSWKVALKAELEKIGERAFYSIFRDRKVVFVYAFLEHGQLSLYDEVSTKSCPSVEDLKLIKKPEIYQRLKDLYFLDSMGRLTGKFCAANKERFMEADSKFSETLYEQMSAYRPSSSSTLAKIELLDTAREVRALGFEFKICPIQKTKGSDLSRPNHSSKETLADIPSENKLFFGAEQNGKGISAGSTVFSNSLNGVTGFINIGNSCYINATLQVLFNIPSICDKISDTKKGTSSWKKALKQILEDVNQSTSPSETSFKNFRKEVFSLARKTFPWKEAEQQDAHEFLVWVLSQLKWTPLITSNRYKVKDLIAYSETKDLTHHLSLSVESKGTLQNALDSYFDWEEREEKKHPLQLAIGKSATNWQQAPYIEIFPEYLIVHLKRFRNDGSKISDSLTIPLDAFVMIKNKDGDVINYEVIALVNHLGQSGSGHYTADVKKFRTLPPKEQWIHCNDYQLVEKLPNNADSDAYMIILKAKSSEK